MAAVDYYITGDNGGSDFTDTTWFAQTFTASISYNISSVKLKLYRTGNPNTITVSIRAVDGSGHPTGADLTSGTTDGNTLTGGTSGEWREITFGSSYGLTSGTKYAIVIRCAPDPAHTAGWRRNSAGAYTGGNYESSTDTGSSWTTSSGIDFVFETYGVGGGAPTDKVYQKQLVAAAFDSIWYEDSAGSMIQLAASAGEVATTVPLSMFEGYQNVFIANDTTFKVADFGNVKIHTTDIKPATKFTPERGIILVGGTSGAEMVLSFISAADGDAYVYGQRITTDTFVDTDVVTNAAGSVSFTLNADEVAGPHWYDWNPYAGDTNTYGTMPSWATLGCLYRGRFVLSGNQQYPHQWYMSRQGNPFDWQYTAIDPQSPVAGQNADVGEIGDVVKALIPIGDDYLIFGCADSMWLLEGDPVAGGSLDKISSPTGIFGAKSWCIDDAGNIYIVGINGIYTLAPPYREIIGLSQGAIPNFVSEWELDSSLHRVVLGYDRINNGILICRTLLADGTNTNYFYSLDTKGFFPETYPTQCGIYSLFSYDADDDAYRTLLAGSYDGYIRKYDGTSKDDDKGAVNTAIHSYCAMPVQQLGEDAEREGKLLSLTPITAGGASGGTYGDTDTLEIRLFKGDNPELILEDIGDGASAFMTIALTSAGRHPRIRTKLRGAYFGILAVNSIDTETWALEKLIANIKGVGRVR